MSILEYPKTISFDDPILLNKQDLIELDGLLPTIQKFLNESWDTNIISEHELETNRDLELTKQEIQKIKESLYINTSEIECELISKDDVKIKGSSLNEIIKNQNSKNFSAYKLKVKITAGKSYQNGVEIEFGRSYKGENSYEINCFDSEKYTEIRYLIDEYFEKKNIVGL